MLDGIFSCVEILLKTGINSNLFAAHYNQHFKSTAPFTNLIMCTAFKVVKNNNPIKETKTYTKPNFSLCMEEILIFLKNIPNKHAKFTNKNSKIYTRPTGTGHIFIYFS